MKPKSSWPGCTLLALGVAALAAPSGAARAQERVPPGWPAAGEPVETRTAPRQVDPNDVRVPPGYRVEVVASGLSYATDVTVLPDGTMSVTEAGGHTYGTKPEKAPPPRLLRITPDGRKEVVDIPMVPPEVVREAPVKNWVMVDGKRVPTDYVLPEGIISPLTGASYNPSNGLLYLSSRARYHTYNPKTGEFRTIIDGLPSWGEFLNHKPIFGPDGKMYFVQSSQGQLGPVDAHFMKVISAWNKPLAREVPCQDVTLVGNNYKVHNGFTSEKGDSMVVATYLPPGFRAQRGQVVEGQPKCNGAMYRANPDGTGLEVVAWGLRSNFGYDFTPSGRLFVTQNSCNPIPPRQTYDDWEPIYEIDPNGPLTWYGWPDYCSSFPVTDKRFWVPEDPDFLHKPGQEKPEVLTFDLTEETHRRLLRGQAAPPAPKMLLPVHSAAEGMVFGRREWGMDPEFEAFVALWGNIVPFRRDYSPGFKVVRIDLRTGMVQDFLTNEGPGPASKLGNKGLERPIQVSWGPDGALYVVDFGVININENGMHAVPNTGVV
jgi:glucose/arabinose dehydrogenase